ncbi:DUF421 domain-containing protein [Aquiflexum sp. TKW24L]|uniref:DUF421 domain-containing protein n=1 Tax=Aquiflexum sp. TKW24L TaxID=2942212 RepID=UPI0020BD4997|nr:DUF421 domain-containing protein [Aquiflexum sp. TKW24L]MCL6261558.1 DUF421 domain-containing protein [Aquiflexum sp. TKW24L]
METTAEPSIFDWTRLMIGEEMPYAFLFEVVFRSFVMFIIVLLVLRLIGKRGIKQLSVFELALIISLGSAAGDPMFYYEVGLLPALVVFIVIIFLYKGITYLSEKSERIERFVEGVPVQLIENGKIKFENFNKEAIAHDEFFAQLRLKNVDHLGQVHKAFIETSGELSIFYFDKDQVKWGLPILPDRNECLTDIKNVNPLSEKIACAVCGTLADEIAFASNHCGHCGKSKWISAKNHPRIV